MDAPGKRPPCRMILTVHDSSFEVETRRGGIQGVRPRADDARGVAGCSARRGCGWRGQLAGRAKSWQPGQGARSAHHEQGRGAALRPRLLVFAAGALLDWRRASPASLTGWQVASLRSAVAVVTLAILLPNSGGAPAVDDPRRRVLRATLILFVQPQSTTAATIFCRHRAAVCAAGRAVPSGRARGEGRPWFMLALAVGLFFSSAGSANRHPQPFVGNPRRRAATWAGSNRLALGTRSLTARRSNGASHRHRHVGDFAPRQRCRSRASACTTGRRDLPRRVPDRPRVCATSRTVGVPAVEASLPSAGASAEPDLVVMVHGGPGPWQFGGGRRF